MRPLAPLLVLAVTTTVAADADVDPEPIDSLPGLPAVSPDGQTVALPVRRIPSGTCDGATLSLVLAPVGAALGEEVPLGDGCDLGPEVLSTLQSRIAGFAPLRWEAVGVTTPFTATAHGLTYRFTSAKGGVLVRVSIGDDVIGIAHATRAFGDGARIGGVALHRRERVAYVLVEWIERAAPDRKVEDWVVVPLERVPELPVQAPFTTFATVGVESCDALLVRYHRCVAARADASQRPDVRAAFDALADQLRVESALRKSELIGACGGLLTALGPALEDVGCR